MYFVSKAIHVSNITLKSELTSKRNSRVILNFFLHKVSVFIEGLGLIWLQRPFNFNELNHRKY